MTRNDDLGDNASLTPNDRLGDVHLPETGDADAERAAFDAVWHSGLMTGGAYADARIWRAVQIAVDAMKGPKE